jgi:hypothetical protein
MVSFYAQIVANARMQTTWEKQHTLKEANHKTKERKKICDKIISSSSNHSIHETFPFHSCMELFISTIEIPLDSGRL